MTTQTVVSWRGVPVDQRTADMLDEAMRLIGNAVGVVATQGSYSNIPVCAGTHRGGGAINLMVMPGGGELIVVRALRQVGFAAWFRRVGLTGSAPYIQALAVGCPDLSPEAMAQVRAYMEGRNGLPGNAPDDGPREFVGVTWETYQGQRPARPGG